MPLSSLLDRLAAQPPISRRKKRLRPARFFIERLEQRALLASDPARSVERMIEQTPLAKETSMRLKPRKTFPPARETADSHAAREPSRSRMWRLARTPITWRWAPARLALLVLAAIVAHAGAATAGVWQYGDVLTYTQGSWSGTTAGVALLNSEYDAFYGANSDILEVGIPGPSGYSIRFDGAASVIEFLPQAGTPTVLDADKVDPVNAETGLFGGDVVALQLDVDFSDAGLLVGSSGIPFGNLILTNFSKDFDGYVIDAANLNGLKVRDFLGDVNTALGGGSSNIASISALDDILGNLDVAFDQGNVTPFAQDHLIAPASGGV